MASDISKPEGYPLPWCDALDAPYWSINLQLCIRSYGVPGGWRERQSGKAMSEIIPELDGMIAEMARG